MGSWLRSWPPSRRFSRHFETRSAVSGGLPCKETGPVFMASRNAMRWVAVCCGVKRGARHATHFPTQGAGLGRGERDADWRSATHFLAGGVPVWGGERRRQAQRNSFLGHRGLDGDRMNARAAEESAIPARGQKR